MYLAAIEFFLLLSRMYALALLPASPPGLFLPDPPRSFASIASARSLLARRLARRDLSSRSNLRADRDGSVEHSDDGCNCAFRKGQSFEEADLDPKNPKCYSD